MKKRNTFILAGIAAVSCCLAAYAESGEAMVNYGSTVTDFQAGNARVLVYYPSSNAADVSGFQTSCTAPILLVYPDGGMTDDEVVSYAQTSGLARIASENGSSVCFVQPGERFFMGGSGQGFLCVYLRAFQTVLRSMLLTG